MSTVEDVDIVDAPAIDIRGYRIDVRGTNREGLPTEITGRVLTYGNVDEYGTRWGKRCFNQSLERRLPPILWAHNPELPIGRTRSFQDTDDGLILTFELDDPEFVPQARQAAWQIKNGTIDEFSVGFVRRGNPILLEPSKNDGAYEEIRQADMLENSVVPFGAVPNTAVIGMRALYMANGIRMYVPDRERIEVRVPESNSDPEPVNDPEPFVSTTNDPEPANEPETNPEPEQTISRADDPAKKRITDHSTYKSKTKKQVIRVGKHDDETMTGIVKSRTAARIAAEKAEEDRKKRLEQQRAEERARQAVQDDIDGALTALRHQRR